MTNPKEPKRGRMLFDRLALDTVLDAEIGRTAESPAEPRTTAAVDAALDDPEADPFIARIRERGKGRASGR